MAKQKGIVKLKGTIGDITFLKTQDGYLAKEKTSIPAERIAKDPAFQRTRENGAEFGRAGKAGKTLRNAFRTLVQTASDSRMTSRLIKAMVQVLQSDKINKRGQRTVADGDAGLLTGFEFNKNSNLSSTVFMPYSADIDRAGGKATVSIPGFSPSVMIAAPAGTTHFKFRTGVAGVDFETDETESGLAETEHLPWSQDDAGAINLSVDFQAGNDKVIFLVIGIEFTQEVNGLQYPLKNGAFNSMAIVKVSGN